MGFDSDKINLYYQRYNEHKKNAKQRDIEFLFSFPDWLEFWGPADIDRRGNKPNDLVCARLNDRGPYSKDNCYIITHKENLTFNMFMKFEFYDMWSGIYDITLDEFLQRVHRK